MHTLGNICSVAIALSTFVCVSVFHVRPALGKGAFATDDQILVANNGLTVLIGRSAYLTSADLQFRANPADRCLVTVLDNDPLAQRPGRLAPLNFPCNFRPQEVAYTHFGAPISLSDTIRLQLRYDSFRETMIIPFSINVTILSAPHEVVTKNSPLWVDRSTWLSNPISKNTTKFTYNRDTEQCKISLLPLVSGQPKYGEVSGDISKLQLMDCEDFLNSSIKYKHKAQNNFPSKDYLPFVVHLLDLSGKMSKFEYFHITVRILGGKENEKPVLESGLKLSLEVDQLLMTALQPDILAARDAETPSDFLLFSFGKQTNNLEGYFINTDDRNRRVTSFYQRDVRELKIAYVPHSPHSSSLSRTFYIDMHVVDADGAASAPFKLKILVRPLIMSAPRVVINRGLQLFEGQSKVIHSEFNFQVGGSSVDKIQIYVAGGLRHGHVTIPDKRKYFTVADLRAGAVAYQHDDSDSFSDNIVFKITDGEAAMYCLFPVWIFLEDDEPPILNVNTGLEIRKNNVAEITSHVLSATDRDSDVTQLRYILESPYSGEGVILKRQVLMPENPEEWEFKSGVYEQVVKEFTHGDVLSGLIFYKQVGTHRSEHIIHKIPFHIVDTGDPPNRSGGKELVVNIFPLDYSPPYLHQNTTLVMEVANYQTAEIKKKFFRFTDYDTDDRDIRFNITSLPTDTDKNTALSAGLIVSCDEPERAITSFSQGQINHNEICYNPPDEDPRLATRLIHVTFDVEDKNGNVLRDQTLSIYLMPVSIPPPTIRNSGISVSEGGYVTLTQDMLDAVTAGTDKDTIEFVLLGPPRHGLVKKKSKAMGRGDSFTRRNLKNGDVEYLNDSEYIGDDLVVLDVTDGIHHIPLRVRVHVGNTDDARPATLSGSNDSLKLKMQVQEGKSSPLPLESLRSSESDSRSTKLVLERAPYDGLIRRGDAQTTEFTLADVVNGLMVYQHSGSEVGLAGRGDHFQIAVLSPKKPFVIDGVKLSKILVEVEILPVDNQPPIVAIGAPFEVPESKKAPLLPRHIDATDADSDTEEILCMVILKPRIGYLENINPLPGSILPNIGIPISSFTIGEVRQSAINYVQSVHKGSEPRNDTMTFRCTDGINHSPDFRFDIRITPYNDEIPSIVLREFDVMEGKNMRIDSEILKVKDEDVPSDKITFLITTQPLHGKIVRQTREGSFKIQSFSLEDISGESTIAYEHDDSETLTDSFTFNLTDGIHKISKTVPINITPLDDEVPRLVVNNGMLISAGDSQKITNKMLRVEDLDTKEDVVFYVRSNPKYGTLRYIQGNVVIQLTQDSTFTQKDIDQRKIEYVHTNKEGLRDVIKLDISDKMNWLTDRYFYITVEGPETATPKIFNKGIQLSKNGVIILTTDLLSETELAASSSEVTFTLTRAPNRGHLESVSQPKVSISSFTLRHLVEKKIRYVHAGEDEQTIDSFEFVEGKGEKNPAAYTFRVQVSDTKNRKPIVMYQPLHLKAGDNKPLTQAELKVVDLDTAPSNITITVTQSPSRGVLLHNVSRVLTSFTLAEVLEGLISYQHDGSAAKEDRFSFTVSDGDHSDFFVYPDTETTSQPQTIFVHINPDDGGVPQINVNKGASCLTKLAGGLLGFTITNRVLSVEDRDIPEDNLFYFVSSPPSWGYIINRAIGNKTIHYWTQDCSENKTTTCTWLSSWCIRWTEEQECHHFVPSPECSY
ncbi:extracellular matrix protein 3, partial [Biomphalaria glabrata]